MIHCLTCECLSRHECHMYKNTVLLVHVYQVMDSTCIKHYLLVYVCQAMAATCIKRYLTCVCLSGHECSIYEDTVFFVLFFLPFITLFSPSSDIQGVGEGHPPTCLTNYKYGILMVPCSHLSFIYHAFFKQ